ncbi:hypothetical protein ABVT39_013895 [Epinephelus coioides]
METSTTSVGESRTRPSTLPKWSPLLRKLATSSWSFTPAIWVGTVGKKTHCAIIARYYWPGMEDDIRKWIAQCPQCQARRATIKEKREYNPIEVTEEKVCNLIKTEEICKGLRDQATIYKEVKANIEAKQQKVRKRKEDREERTPAKIKKLSDPTPLAGPRIDPPTTSVTPPARQTMSCETQGLPLSADILMRDVWAGRRRTTLWSRLGPYKLYMEDLLYLAPGKELESQIVNAYLTMVGRKSGAVIIDSYGMTAVWQGKQTGLKWLAFDRDVAAGAVCHEGHWTLIVSIPKC